MPRMNRKSTLIMAAVLTAIALATGALTGVFSRGDDPVSNRDETPIPVDPGIGNGQPGDGLIRVEAPIDAVDVAVMESAPPQYLLKITAGLPSGCARQFYHEATQDGSKIDVKVYNTLPEGSPVCTAIYGTYSVNINLGSDFISGRQYTVQVNDEVFTFTAQ
ncbi:MAG: hypothetical protein ACREH3_11100 [Geminicoccales bacterium]